MPRKGQQIKKLRVDVSTKGAKKAEEALKGIEAELQNIKSSAKDIGGFLKGPTKAMETLFSRSKAVSNSFNTMAKSASSVNRALSGGTSKAEKSISSYMDNMELVSLTLMDVAKNANAANVALEGVNATIGMENLVVILKKIEQNTGKTSARVKQTRDNISDLDVTANRTTEELIDMGVAMSDLGKKTKTTGKKIKTTDNNLRGLNGTGSRSTRSFSKMAFTMNPLTTLYAKLAINIFAVSEAFRIISKAANMDRLAKSTAAFSASVSGVNVKALAADMQEASAGALGLHEAMKFATKGVAFDFTAEQLDNLTRGARKAAIALGIDFSDAMDRVLRGISKQEIELFDELGVVIRLTPAFRDYSIVLGKTVDALTDYERQVALTIGVQKQLDKRFGGIEAGATGWEKLGVAVKDFTNTSLIGLASILEPLAASFADVLKAVTPIPDKFKLAAESAEIFEKAMEVENVAAATQALAEYTKLQKEATKIALEGSEALNIARQEDVDSLAAVLKVTVLLAAATVSLWGPSAVALAVAGIAAITVAVGVMLKVLRTALFVSYLLAATNPLTAVAAIAAAGTALLAVNLLLDQAADILVSEVEDSGAKIKKTADATITMVEKLRDMGWLGDISEDNAKAAIVWSKGLTTATASIGELTNKLIDTKSPIDKLVLQFAKFDPSNINEGMKEVAKTIEDMQDRFENFQEMGTIPKIVSSFDEWNKLLRENQELVRRSTDILPTLEKLDILNTSGRRQANEKLITKQIDERNKLLISEEKIAGRGVTTRVRQLNQEISILKAKKAQLVRQRELNTAIADSALSFSLQLASLKEGVHFESQILAINIMQLEVRKQLRDDAGQDTDELQRQITLLKQKLTLQSASESKDLGAGVRDITKATLERQISLAGSETAKIPLKRELLELQAQELAGMTDGLAKSRAELQLLQDKAALKREEQAAPFVDAATSFSGIQALAGLSDLQTAGLSMSESISTTFANAIQADTGFIDFLMDNTQAFMDFSVNIANAAGSIFATISKEKVAGISREIAAEKKRDGKSAESLAKIKALNTKKIKEEAKTQKAQLLMSTATGMMNIWAGPMGKYPPAAIAASVALAAMGAIQLSNIDKAVGGSIAALSGGFSGMSITGGTRDNSIDVSQTASRGEFAFASGAFQNATSPGRVGGGFSEAGASIGINERGPEIITPVVPVNVTPAGEVADANRPQVVFAPVLNITAMDTQSIIDRSEDIYEALEQEINSKLNTSLERLGQL